VLHATQLIGHAARLLYSFMLTGNATIW